MGLAARLGDAAARSRRHRRFALAGIVLLVVAGVLIFLGREDDDGNGGGAPTGVAATCAEFGDRVQREYALSFPEGAPVNDEAAAEYLSHAFADTMEDLVTELRTYELDGDVATIVDDLADRIDDVRASPGDWLQASPLSGISGEFDDADLPACGSEFFAPSE